MMISTNGVVQASLACQIRRTTRNSSTKRRDSGFWTRSMPGSSLIFRRYPKDNDGSLPNFYSA
jgi:hypothetical protein